MPILWGEKAQTRKASKSLETGKDNLDTSKQTFEKTFIVIGDSTDEDMIETVEKLNDIPRVGDRESNIGTCISVDVTESDFVCGGDDGKPVYEVTVKYDTSAEREGGADAERSGKDPKGLWQQPDVQIPDYNLPTNSFRWGFEETTGNLLHDYNGRPTVNANGEYIEVEFNDYLLIAEITCYTLRNVEVEVLTKYSNTVNEKVFAGYDPFRIRLNISCDYEEMDLGDENHTICRWKKFTLKFSLDSKKKGDIAHETITYFPGTPDQYSNTIDTAGDEKFLLRVPHTGTKAYDADARDLVTIRKDELAVKGYITLEGEFSKKPTLITFQNFKKADFSELSAYLDCDIEYWLQEGLESNVGEKLENVMKQMRRKNDKRNKKRNKETNDNLDNQETLPNVEPEDNGEE